MDKKINSDVIVVGGGVVGTAIARELSKYKLDIILLEKEDDVAMGTSKANSGIIHAGYNADASTLKGQLNVKANPMFDKLCNNLKVPFKRIGSLVVGFSRDDLKILRAEKENGEKMGIKGLKIIEKSRLFELEPNLNPEASCALYAPTAGIVSAYELTIALADNAVLNGVRVILESEVVDMITEDNKIIGVKTVKGNIFAPIVINAAGLYSDRVSAMADAEEYKIKPRKGEYHLLDKKWGNLVKHVLFPIPTEVSKGILVTPTAHGNLMVGPNSIEIENKNDLRTTEKGLNEVINGAKKLVPSLNKRDVITSFSGLRATADGGDFIIKKSNKIKGLINVIGIQSPGLTSAPAIAEMVVDILRDLYKNMTGMDIVRKNNYQEKLKKKPVFIEYFENDKLDSWQKKVNIDENYGEIICRCEQVTRGEIIDAIHRPVPAKSLDAIKRRTRAGAGRCQGGFCGPRVVKILAKELGISPLDVTKKGKDSNVLLARIKELI